MAGGWAGPQATQGRMAALAGALEAARAEAGECRAAADAQRQAAAEASSRAGRVQDRLQAATAASALAASGRDQVRQPLKVPWITACTHANMPTCHLDFSQLPQSKVESAVRMMVSRSRRCRLQSRGRCPGRLPAQDWLCLVCADGWERSEGIPDLPLLRRRSCKGRWTSCGSRGTPWTLRWPVCPTAWPPPMPSRSATSRRRRRSSSGSSSGSRLGGRPPPCRAQVPRPPLHAIAPFARPPATSCAHLTECKGRLSAAHCGTCFLFLPQHRTCAVSIRSQCCGSAFRAGSARERAARMPLFQRLRRVQVGAGEG